MKALIARASLCGASLFASLAAGKAALVEIEGKLYVEVTEFKCFVEKAVPAPERGSTWYTQSSIGDVWLKAEPTAVVSAFSETVTTLGHLRFYRTDQLYEELITYPEAQWIVVEQEVQGTGDRSIGIDATTDRNPFFFSISKIERQGLFHGKDGKPAYFLSRCTFSPALVELKGFDKAYAELLRSTGSKQETSESNRK